MIGLEWRLGGRKQEREGEEVQEGKGIWRIRVGRRVHGKIGRKLGGKEDKIQVGMCVGR